ncbi:MAG: mechanosensitive ion channel family protein, partial [Ilumatobacteraceae bacterium]
MRLTPVPDIEISQGFDASSVTGRDVLFAAIALVAGFVLASITKRALRRFFRNVEGLPEDTGNIIARLTGYVIVLIGLMVALEILGFSWGPLGGLLLLVLIVVVLAAKPLLEDLGAGLTLQVRRPFVIGDLVEVDDEVQGVVAEINARTVVVTTIDGRKVLLPSRSVLQSPIVNLTVEDHRMTEFEVGVAYGTDLDRACAVAVDAMEAADLVLADPRPEALVEEFGDSSIGVSCRFWHAPD